jgi:hypothetical protein
MPLSALHFWPRRSPDEGQSADRAISTRSLPNKNTGDLQWEMRANYNASPCVNERNGAGAATMGINGKTIRRTMETMKNTGGATTSGCNARRQAMGVRPRLCQTNRVCLQDLRMSLGAIPGCHHDNRQTRNEITSLALTLRA